MSRKIPSQEFHSTFTPAVCAGLVSALRQAYDDAVEYHRPECGSNPLTFGVNVYAFACKRLGGIAEEEDGAVSLQSKGPSFRIQVGKNELGCHKVGSTAQQDIWNSFPGNRGGVRTLVEEQMPLPMFEPEEVQGRKFVLAHTGNPDDGLCAVYICKAKRLDSNGQIAEWEFAHEVWKRGNEENADDLKKADRLPEEQVEEPVLRRKPRKGLGGEHG